MHGDQCAGDSTILHNDLTFFANDPGATILDRFRKTLKDVRFFDVLVGYFRTSGFFRLYDSFKNIEKVRILVGINIDTKAFEIIESAKASQKKINFESHKHTKDNFTESLSAEMEHVALERPVRG